MVFNLPIGEMCTADVPVFIDHFAKDTADIFDDSVIKFIAPTRRDDKDIVQVVSDFPIEGRDAIKSILDSELSLEEKLIEIKELVEIRDGK